MEFRLLGPVEIHRTTGETVRLRRRQERLALGVVLLSPGRVVTTERLVDLLWERPPVSATRSALPALMSRIRSVLGSVGDGDEPVRLVARGGGYLLEVEPDSVDVHRFSRLVAQARAIAEPATRSARLAAALELWRGPALADAATGAVRDRLCGGLEELRFAAISDRIDAELDAGRHDKLVAELAALTEEHPLRERLHGQLMIALYRCGRRADALETYRRARQTLAAELGLEPGRQLRAVHASVIADTAGAGVDTTRETPAATVPAQLPLDLAGFVGRAAHLRQLDALLTARSTATTTCVITGTAGVGKTTLAVHWAHRAADQYPDGQLYLNLHGFDRETAPLSAREATHGLLEALGVPATRIPKSLESQAGLYRSLLSGRRVLILLDNARDAEQVRPLLPGTPGCLVLVTSRHQLTGLVAVQGAHPMALGLLAWDEAHELLARRLGTDRIAAEPHATSQIITQTAQLPLALAIVAARAATNGSQPLAALARELSETSGLDSFDGGDAMADLRAVFSWSYQTLGTPEARLFRLLGLHPGPDVALPAAASLAGLPAPQARAMLATLARAHLIVEHTAGRYTFHDLLRSYAAELAHLHDPATERRAALRRALDHYLHTAYGAHQVLSPHHDPIPLASAGSGTVPERFTDHRQAMGWYTANHRVLLAAVRQAADAGMDTIAWQLPWTLLEFFDRQGHSHHQADTFHVALGAARRLADPAGQAHAHRGLGRALGKLRRRGDAHQHLLRALDLYRDIGDQAGQARTHGNLAGVLEQGRHAEAIDHDQQALTLYRALGDLAGQARALNNIGWYHALCGDYTAAITHCQQAIDLIQQTGDRRGQANTWHSLGYAHHHLSHHADAASCYQQALNRYREVGDRYHEADTLTHLGDTQHAAGDAGAAHHAWSRAWEILDTLGHPDAARVNAKLSAALPAATAP